LDDLDDEFNIEYEVFEAKIQENKVLTTLFTDSELMMSWKFLSWVRKKDLLFYQPLSRLLSPICLPSAGRRWIVCLLSTLMLLLLLLELLFESLLVDMVKRTI
jgi:hypothetical protein